MPKSARRVKGWPLSTRGAIFSFGGGCDCTDCGSLVPAALDRLAAGVGGLSHGSRAEPPPHRPTAATETGLECSAASDVPAAAAAAGSSDPPTVPVVPTVPTAKMANRRLCKELDEFEAIAAAAAAAATAAAAAGPGVTPGAGAPPPGFSAAPLQPSNLFHWRASVHGPPGSPYEGGTFVLDVRFPPDYPFKPPRVAFVTPLYHPNARAAAPGEPPSSGALCLDLLAELWCPALTASAILTSVVGLLADPCPVDQAAALRPELAAQYRSDRARFDETAAEWTREYAIRAGECAL